MSLLRRHRLMLQLKQLAAERAFHAAGNGVWDEISCAELHARIQTTAIRCGLAELEGLSIDGQLASIESLLERGPESLCTEIAEAIADENTVSSDERKN
jgi:hypothetical protein